MLKVKEQLFKGVDMILSEAMVKKSESFFDVIYKGKDGTKKMAFQFQKTPDGFNVFGYGVNDGFYKGTDLNKFLKKMGVKVVKSLNVSNTSSKKMPI
jgi:hypothetical protein